MDEKNNINNNNEAIVTDINTTKKKHSNSRSLKIMVAIFCLTTIASISGLTFAVINGNNQKTKLDNDLKLSKEEVEKANETIAKYESATETKAVEVKEDNVTIKEIVKPMAIDTKVGDLTEDIKRNFVKMSGKNDDGLEIKNSWPVITFKSLFTNRDASYLFAELEIGHMYEVVKDDRGATRVESGMGGSHASYYRALPSGEWKKSYEGNGFESCENISEEAKTVYKGVKDSEGKSILHCWDKNKTENNGIISF